MKRLLIILLLVISLKAQEQTAPSGEAPAQDKNPPSAEQVAKGITIIKALYGSTEQFANGKELDVTEIAKTRVVDGKLRIYHTRKAFGDPHPYKAKMLKITYLVDGENDVTGLPYQHEQWAGEVNLSASAAVLIPLKIDEAEAKLHPMAMQAIKVTNPIDYDIKINTTFMIPVGNNKIDQLRIYHALPTVKPWGNAEPRFGATDLKFTPLTGVITHHEKTNSHHLLWTIEGAQKPGARSNFTTNMLIRSADRTLGPEAEKVTWDDYNKKPKDPTATIDPEVVAKLHPELAALAAKIRAENTPAMAVRKICVWINENIKYDASVGYTTSDMANILKHKRGHCGHMAVTFNQLAASVGIPVRGTFGFNFMSPDGRKDRLMSIRSDFNNRHTWVEVYLPGIGWVEAEPSYGMKAFSIPAAFVQNNRWFQTYSIWMREGGVHKPHGWYQRAGGFSSHYGVEHVTDFTSKPVTK